MWKLSILLQVAKSFIDHSQAEHVEELLCALVPVVKSREREFVGQ